MRRDDGGFAMMTVVMGIGAMLFLLVVIYQASAREYSGAQNQRRDDTIIVGAEAMLDRYAAKLTIDPLYYEHFVDEAELPRVCASNGPNRDEVVQPGNPWIDGCDDWTYAEPTSFYDHPLMGGRDEIAADDIATLLTVTPPQAGDLGISVTIVSTQQEFGQARSITADIRPESISEFAFLVDQDLRFGSGANIKGKIYVGGDLDFRQTPVQGVVHRNVFAEGAIGRTSGYGPPVFASGSQGYDSTSSYDDIRLVYPEPLDFGKFWDDLSLIRDIACDGGGLCLSASFNPDLGLSTPPTAWLLQPTVSGGNSRIRVSAAYSNTTTSCLTAEEWWWVNSQDATWTLVGTYDVPANGAVWVDGHAVIGLPGDTSKILDSMTIYAGTLGSRKNIVIGSDIIYQTGSSGNTILGLIASDEIYVNPSSVGSDNELTFYASLLAQEGSFHVARTCGSSGSVMLPYSGGVPISTLHTNGSMAIRHTGDVAAHFGTRNYAFDNRLEYLRPPLFPLMSDSWSYGNWRETSLPCWATNNC